MGRRHRGLEEQYEFSVKILEVTRILQPALIKVLILKRDQKKKKKTLLLSQAVA